MKSENHQHSECWLHLLVFREASMETFQMKVKMIHQSGGDHDIRSVVRNTMSKKNPSARGMNCHISLDSFRPLNGYPLGGGIRVMTSQSYFQNET